MSFAYFRYCLFGASYIKPHTYRERERQTEREGERDRHKQGESLREKCPYLE